MFDALFWYSKKHRVIITPINARTKKSVPYLKRYENQITGSNKIRHSIRQLPRPNGHTIYDPDIVYLSEI